MNKTYKWRFTPADTNYEILTMFMGVGIKEAWSNEEAGEIGAELQCIVFGGGTSRGVMVDSLAGYVVSTMDTLSRSPEEKVALTRLFYKKFRERVAECIGLGVLEDPVPDSISVSVGKCSLEEVMQMLEAMVKAKEGKA